MKPGFLILLFSCLISFAVQASTSEIPNDTTYIFLKDYGLYKTRKKNAIKHFYKALEDLKTDQPKILVFSTGTYHFYPDGCKTKVYYEANTTNEEPKVCAFHFENIKNLVIDGRGSHLIFHNEMQPFTFDNCQNITLRNVTIDWEQPFIAQAEVLRINNHYMDIGLDPRESPYRLEEGKIVFETGNGQQNEWNTTLEFDRKGRFIVPQTGDAPCLGEHWDAYHAEATMPGIVRLHLNFERKPQIGNYLVMQHSQPVTAGVFITEAQNVSIQNLRLYHTPGPGVLAQNSTDVTIDQYKAIPNRTKDRYFSSNGNGLNIVNCAGEIFINNSIFQGLTNQPINIETIGVLVEEVISESQVKCRFIDNKQKISNWGNTGDQINFIMNDQQPSATKNTIKTFTPFDENYFTIDFKNPVPDNLKKGDAIENLSWITDVTVSNSDFQSSRGSGLRLATAGKVLIENNTFESSGSAVLINGNPKYANLSAATTDILIHDNIFTSYCNTGIYSNNEAVISIAPTVTANTEKNNFYQKNIRIEKNQFSLFDYALLYARSVDGLSFKQNAVNRIIDYPPFHDRLFTFSFEQCKSISILNNTISEDILGKNIYLKKTPESELNTDLNSKFTIEKY